MHAASRVMAAGADFRLLGPRQTMLRSTKPVVAICAVRTGCGKSQTTRRIGQYLRSRGLKVALVRHPMPYGDLQRMRVQRFATLADIDASDPTVEEREEYEAPVAAGMVVFAGVDYADPRGGRGGGRRRAVGRRQQRLPLLRPDLLVTVTDPLRPGHELRYHPGELNLRMADVVVINKIDSAVPEDVAEVLGNIGRLNPRATVVTAMSPVVLEAGPSLKGSRVLVVEDGPTITHGGMPFGAGTVAARQAGAAELVDPRPYAVGSIRDTYDTYPAIGPVLPAMGYGDAQLRDLEATIRAVEQTPCDAVVSGTPMDLGRILDPGHPIRRVTYELEEVGQPTLAFDKACHYFGLAVRRAPLRDDYLVDVEWVADHITPNTVALVGSAGNYPHGLVDPIADLSALAVDHDLGLHVDGCLGGFLLPWGERLGYDIPVFDFRLPGVTSMSADTHKYGYALKGTSVLLYRNRDLRRLQYFTFPGWPGGLYVSPGMSGSRSGGLIAATWAAMVNLGEQGYLEAARAIFATAATLRDGIAATPGLTVIGNPTFLVAFTSEEFDIFHVNDHLIARGWRMNGLQHPKALHFCVTRPNTRPGVAAAFLADLRRAVEYARSATGEPSSGALYGLGGTPDDDAVVNGILSGYLDLMYDVAP
jgi:predicted GTPase